MNERVSTYPRPRPPVETDLPTLRLGSDLEGRAFPVGDPRDYARIPDDTLLSLAAWVIAGIPPGGFLTGVLTNDLKRVVDHADHRNLEAIAAVVCWLTNNAPMSCWGGIEKAKHWQVLPQAERAACLERSARWGRFFLEETA